MVVFYKMVLYSLSVNSPVMTRFLNQTAMNSRSVFSPHTIIMNTFFFTLLVLNPCHFKMLVNKHSYSSGSQVLTFQESYSKSTFFVSEVQSANLALSSEISETLQKKPTLWPRPNEWIFLIPLFKKKKKKESKRRKEKILSA